MGDPTNPQHHAPTWLAEKGCTCTFERGRLGRLHGQDMGTAMLRVSTTPGCPVHAKVGHRG